MTHKLYLVSVPLAGVLIPCLVLASHHPTSPIFALSDLDILSPFFWLMVEVVMKKDHNVTTDLNMTFHL